MTKSRERRENMHLLLPKDEQSVLAAWQRTFAANRRILTLYARYLNENPTLITRELIEELCASCNATPAEAFSAILSAAFDLDEEKNEQICDYVVDYTDAASAAEKIIELFMLGKR